MTYKRKVFDIFDLILGSEKCKKCDTWMSTYFHTTDKHSVLEKMCPNEKCGDYAMPPQKGNEQ